MLLDQIIASQQVSFLREAERDQWQRLVDSNIRSGTLACLWCLKAQYVKRLSIAFNKWKLISALKGMQRKPPAEDTPRKAASKAVQNAIAVMNRCKPPAPAPDAPQSSSNQEMQFPWELRRAESFSQLSSALLEDADTKRRLLLDLSADIITRSGTKGQGQGQRAPPSSSSASEEVSPMTPFTPRAPEDWQSVLRVRHGVGGDFVRDLLQHPPPPRPQQQHQSSAQPQPAGGSSRRRSSYMQPTSSALKKALSPEDAKKAKAKAAAPSRRASTAARRGSSHSHSQYGYEQELDDAFSSSLPLPPHIPSVPAQHRGSMASMGMSTGTEMPAGSRRRSSVMDRAQERLIFGELAGDPLGPDVWKQNLRR